MFAHPAPVWAAAVRDGRQITVRPLSGADTGALAAFLATISDESLYQRFFCLRRTLSAAQWARMTDVDGANRLALAAHDDAGAIVGVGRYMRYPGSSAAELAFLVTDSWQGQGMGPLLFARLRETAAIYGITRFTGSVLPTNRRMLAALQRHAQPSLRTRDGIVEIDLPLTVPTL